MTTTERMTAERLNSEFGLTVSSEFVPWSKSRNYDPKIGKDTSRKSLNWRVTLKKNGRDVLTCNYSAGIAHAPSYKKYNVKQHGELYSLMHGSHLEIEVEQGVESIPLMGGDYYAHPTKTPILPDTADVVWSLIMDAEAINHATYESWAADYGYEEDSRKGEALYRECLSIGLKLRAALGETDLERLREAFQDF